MTEKVVVTGGAGFIGSHLSEELRRQGYDVVIIDDLSTGKEANVAALLRGGNAELIRGSVTDLPLLRKVFSGSLCVFHLAALASVPRSIEEPELSHEVNATGTLNVLIAARDTGVRKVIYASSAAIYGLNADLPVKENSLPDPRSPYAVAKLAGEYYCRVFQDLYSLPSVCLRYFNVFGPRQDPGSQYAAVIPIFISNVRNGSPLLINGDGEQTRDFVFVRDAVGANVWAAQSDVTGIYNIGRGESTSINELVKLITGISGKKTEAIYQEVRPGDVRYSVADVSGARASGYRPEFDLNTGLAETIKWFEGNRVG